MDFEFPQIEHFSAEWDSSFKLGKLIFHRRFGPEVGDQTEQYPNFILVKTKQMIDDYVDRITNKKIDSLLELGIFKGGSVAFFNEYLKPEKHMAVDIHKEQTGLDQLSERVREEGRDLFISYNLSQGEPDKIIREFESHFGTGAEFDLIIDDASHNYELSMLSFNGLFGRLKPGGIYAIEDWGWAHWMSYQQPDNLEFNNQGLSNLILYCVMACASGTAGIARVDVTPDTVFVHRDMKPVPSDFRIESAFPTRGRAFHPL